MHREANRDLMVAWINNNLSERAHLSLDTAVVIYDEDKLFHYALPPVMGPVPTRGISAALHKTGGRYFSVGIV